MVYRNRTPACHQHTDEGKNRAARSAEKTSCDFVYLPFPSLHFLFLSFLADRTNGSAIGTVLRPSVAVCRL